MAGENEQGGSGSQEGQQTGTTNDPGTQGQQGTEDPGTNDEPDFDSLPEATKTEIRTLRRENAKLRRAAKTPPPQEKGQEGQKPSGAEEILAKLAELLTGQAPPAPKATPASTKDEGTAQELRQARVELAVVRVAGAAGADPDALLDSRSFLREIEDLDPSDASFDKDVRDAVKAAVGQNPGLKAKGIEGQRKPPGKSGGDLGGGKTPGTREFTSPQQRLAAAYAANNP